VQEKQEAEKAAAQPSCIPGYFDPTSLSVCVPSAGHTGSVSYLVVSHDMGQTDRRTDERTSTSVCVPSSGHTVTFAPAHDAAAHASVDCGDILTSIHAVVKRELLDTAKARKLAYYGHTTREQGSCLEKEMMRGIMPGARRRGRPCTAWMDNFKTWTGLSVEESIRMKEDRDKWRKYVHGVANPRIEDG